MDATPGSESLSQLAIDAALDCRLMDALKINKKIIKFNSQIVDALARLARVYLEVGRINLAKKYYSEVVKIDPYNPIALKNLKIIKSFKSVVPTAGAAPRDNDQVSSTCNTDRLSPSLFLQEPGKTKMVNLLKVAEPQKLSQAFCGMRVEMAVKNRKVTVVDSNGDYLGVLPDDINHHLLRLSKGGNKYEIFIKSIRVNSLSVIIKETFRSKKFKNQPSFLEYSNSSIRTPILTSLDRTSDDEDSEETEEEQEA